MNPLYATLRRGRSYAHSKPIQQYFQRKKFGKRTYLQPKKMKSKIFQPPIEDSAISIVNEDNVLPEDVCWTIETGVEDTVPEDMIFDSEVIMDTFDDAIDVNVFANQNLVDDNENETPTVETDTGIEGEIFDQEASRVPLEQPPTCLSIEVSERFEMAVGDLWFNQSNEVVQKLQNILEKGFLPTDHILYRILNDVISFIEVMNSDEHAKRNWRWSDVVKDFFSSVRKVGGKRTYNLLRGPGNFQKGSIHENFDVLKYNIPLPHNKTLRRQQSGYTPRSGIYLLYLTGFVEKSVRESTSILEYDNVTQVFVCRGIDGFGLKAGCGRDQRLNELIGMDFVLDINWINNHPEPDIKYLKAHLIREAEPELLTTLDGKISFPVGVNYLTEKMKHGRVIDDWKESISIIETCLNCLKGISTNDSVIINTEKTCSSYCANCASMDNVCEDCSILGYTSVEADKRQCMKCIKSGLKCIRLKCAFTASDCGSPYKKAIVVYNAEMDHGNENDNDNDLSHKVRKPTGAIPDIVHICKCICCSLQNWFLICDKTRINLGMLRVIRERDSSHGEALRRILPLDSLRKRDRMNSKHPLHVSCNELWNNFKCKKVCPKCMPLSGNDMCDTCSHCLEICDNTVVLVPLVPEKWQLSKDNYEDVMKSPLSICEGSPGIYYVANAESVFSVRLHYPVEVMCVVSGLCKCSAICNFDGVLLLSDINTSEIAYVDCAKVLIPKTPTKKEDLINFLTTYGISFDPRSKVSDLKPKVQDKMKLLKEASNTKRKLSSLEMVTALCMYGDLLFAAATLDGVSCIVEMSIDKAADLRVSATKTIKLPGISLLLSMTISNNTIFYVDGYARSSISSVYRESDTFTTYSLQTNAGNEHQFHGILRGSNDKFFVTCTKQRKVFKVTFNHEIKRISLEHYCGSGKYSRSYGMGTECSFIQPTAMCSERKSIILVDTGSSSVSLISPLQPLWRFLSNIRTAYTAFNVHSRSKQKHSLVSALPLLEQFHKGVQSTASAVANKFNIQMSTLNGSWGSVSSETVGSIGILREQIEKFCKMYPILSNNCLSKAITTIINEHINAQSRAYAQNAAVDTLSYAISFPSVVEDAMKRISSLPYHYFTSEKRHYELPDDVTQFEIPKLPQLTQKKLTMDELVKILEFRKRYVEPVRVGTVRADTTKDKFSTIPIALYGETQPNILEVDICNFFTNTDDTDVQHTVLYAKHSVFSLQVDDTYCIAVTKVYIFDSDKSTSSIACDIFKATFTSTVPKMEFFERNRVKYSKFKKHYGPFQELFGADYDCEDSIEIDEALYEAIFIFQNFGDDIEEDEEDMESGDLFANYSENESGFTSMQFSSVYLYLLSLLIQLKIK